MSLNVLKLNVIISRQVEADIVIYKNHILEAVHHIVARHIVINQIQTINLRIVVVLREVL